MLNGIYNAGLHAGQVVYSYLMPGQQSSDTQSPPSVVDTQTGLEPAKTHFGHYFFSSATSTATVAKNVPKPQEKNARKYASQNIETIEPHFVCLRLSDKRQHQPARYKIAPHPEALQRMLNQTMAISTEAKAGQPHLVEIEKKIQHKYSYDFSVERAVLKHI